MADPLALDPDAVRALGRRVVEQVARYYEGLATRPVLVPTTSSALRARLEEPLPQEGADFDGLLRQVDETVAAFARHNGHPRFFGYVASGSAPVAALSALLSAAYDVNVTGWRSAPSATELERVTVGWLGEMLGYPSGALGLLTSGGSMSNLSALAAARSAKAPVDVARDGVAAVGRRMRIYVSEEGHFSVEKAAALLGLGTRDVRAVPTDAGLRIDVAALRRLVREDLEAGHLPFCVVGNAGTTATGACDPLDALADVALEHGLWFHVDAAYGGFAALVPSARPLLAGIERADSVTLDPHKWLHLPVGCGSVLYRDPASARAAFRHDAEYTRPLGLERDEAFAFWDHGPELSRPFRALPLWMLLRCVGTRRLGEAVEGNIACAEHLARLVGESRDFEMLAPVGLSIACFRHRPPGDAVDLDAWNERLLLAVQRAGRSYLSNARVRGRFALRACVLNYRTTPADMEALLDDVRRAARDLEA